ncbi:MAG TPA: hypothetical protein VI895_08495 [Bdellovibrionota bacterium]|nr:hypothetical protein [Bdellovibrionota bacterium]
MTTSEEQRLFEKLKRIEALFAGTTSVGEQQAAASAMDRIRERLRNVQETDPAIEFQFGLRDVWSRQLFMALLRRYGIRPYRYSRQRQTTVMARVSRSFVNETLWPEFKEIEATLRAHLHEITERIIGTAIHGDSSDAEVRREPLALDAGATSAVMQSERP